MTGARDLEEDLVLAFELNLLVVESPRQQHCAIRGEELIAAQTGGSFLFRLGGSGHFSAGSVTSEGRLKDSSPSKFLRPRNVAPSADGRPRQERAILWLTRTNRGAGGSLGLGSSRANCVY